MRRATPWSDGSAWMPRGLPTNSASLSTKHNTVTHRAVSFDCTYRNSPVSSPSAAPSTLIEDRKQLVEYLESGSKPPSDWRIDTEHEKSIGRATCRERVCQ